LKAAVEAALDQAAAVGTPETVVNPPHLAQVGPNPVTEENVI
jgi:hypothetical protein